MIKKTLCFFLFVAPIFTILAQKKLPEGWDIIRLEGKEAYMNLVNGEVSTTFPTKAAKKPPPPEPEYEPTIFHTIQKGETLFSIAKKYNIHVDKIYRLNVYFDYENIKPGQQIVVGYKEENTIKPVDTIQQYKETKKVIYHNDLHVYHVVEEGETLYRISKQYGVSVNRLKKINRLLSNNIVVGQQLKIPN